MNERNSGRDNINSKYLINIESIIEQAQIYMGDFRKGDYFKVLDFIQLSKKVAIILKKNFLIEKF